MNSIEGYDDSYQQHQEHQEKQIYNQQHQQHQQVWAQRRRASLKRQRTVCGSATWQEYEDEQGNLFYYNESTGVSQWEKPLEFLNPRATDELVKSPYRVESHAEFSDKESDRGNEESSHRKPRKKRATMSFKGLRNAAARSNNIYTIWPCVAIFIVIVSAAILVIIGFTSPQDRRTILGIDINKTNDWVLLLTLLCGGVIVLNIVLSCLCYRFNVCDNMSVILGISKNLNRSYHHDSETSKEYEHHLNAAKKHLVDKRLGQTTEDEKLKRVNTWSVPKSTIAESEELKLMHSRVKHLREQKKSNYRHHRPGRERKVHISGVERSNDHDGGSEEIDGDENRRRRQRKKHKV